MQPRRQTVRGILAKLDKEKIDGQLRIRNAREGRAEVVQMWGRPESACAASSASAAASREARTVARVVAIVSDLMLASRVTTSLGAAGHEVEQVSSMPGRAGRRRPDRRRPGHRRSRELAGTGVPAIGFYSHVDADMKARADACRDRHGGAALADGAGAAGPGREGPGGLGVRVGPGARARHAAAGRRGTRRGRHRGRPRSGAGPRWPRPSAARPRRPASRGATVGRLPLTSGENASAATSSASWALWEVGSTSGTWATRSSTAADGSSSRTS